MKPADLAAALGISPGRLSQLKKRGMPVTGTEAAQEWRKVHCQTWRIRDAAAKRTPPAPPPSDEAIAAAEVVPALGTVAEAEEFLVELKADLAWTKGNARSLWDAGDADNARRWATLNSVLKTKFPIVVARLLKLRQEMKVTVLVGDARAVYAAILHRIRSQIDNLPVRMSSRCNPSDPVLAQTMLEDWRGQCLRAIHGTPI